jgi:hypothetical protein
MRTILRLLLCAVLFFVLKPSLAQTPADLQKKYGATVAAYEIRPGILMTAKFTDAGQACELIIGERHASHNGDVGIPHLTRELVRELIDELVPVSERGEKDRYYGTSLLAGSGSTTSYGYEHVSIKYQESFLPKGELGWLIVKWKNRTCHAG